jgi:hypothetical protein
MLIDNNDLIITVASFEEAIDLKDAVEEAIKQSNLSLEFSGKESTEVSEDSFSSMIKTVLSIDNSRKVRDCLFKCAERAVWNKTKIDKQFFENVENRKFYYAIMFEILKANLMPFIEGLFSKLKGLNLTDLIKSIQK